MRTIFSAQFLLHVQYATKDVSIEPAPFLDFYAPCYNYMYGPDVVCQEAALTRRIAWRRSGGRVGLGPSGKQLHPATPELTAWRKRPADGLQ